MMRFRLLCVLRIIKFALPLAAMFCFGALGTSADAAGSKKSSSSSKSRSSATAKKSSASKKSKARSSSKSTKAKGKRSSKSKAKAEREPAETASLDWIDELPEVELPEASGPAEDELLEPVPETPAP